ncbi:MAG TPA: ATP-binding protein [Actinomycetales bacterium]|nr:ATP-binding protein [Actinomycetales bacterium]
MQSTYGMSIAVGRGRGRAGGLELTTDGGPPPGLQPADAVRLLRRARRALVRAARADEVDTLSSLLREHLGPQAESLSVVEESWPSYEHVNVQRALDVWLEDPALEHRTVGVVGFQHRPFGLAELLAGDEVDDPYGPRPGNVARVNVAAGPDGQVLACVQCAVYLVNDESRRAAVLVRGADPSSGEEGVMVQAVGSDAEWAPQLAARLRVLATEHNVFRGQVLSFGSDVFGQEQTLLRFHRRPTLDPDGLVLPAETLAAVHRQVLDIARHKRQLLAAGQHLKRGVLLYGPPGVGKTHTVRHLIGDLTETTVIQLTGNALHLVAEACSVARSLQPSMVVIEDVDLIAEDRGMYPGDHPLLFQLLNEMDGLAEDADVVFVLTTNRADLLEPALAARPGRIDQAVELTLPDEAARRQLFALYRGGLSVDESRLDDVLARTEGVTASFLKELLRRAALLSATESGDTTRSLRVTADHLDRALDELHDTRNAMTRVLLGAARFAVPNLDEEDDD